jgi:Tfp pilus assembly protein PilF
MLAKFSFLLLLLTISQQLISAECTHIARLVSKEGKVEGKKAGQEIWHKSELDDRFCLGDSLRTGEESRAAVRLTNDTLLNLDSESEIRFGQISSSSHSLLDLLRGVLHFISRTPKSLEVKTPYMNASIEGTEFVVRIEDKGTDVIVLEGVVLAGNNAGSVELNANQAARATAGQQPVRLAIAKPFDAVAWALYYPQLPSLPGEADRLAQRAIESLVQNRPDEAAELTKQALGIDSQSAAAHMAQSYVDQARFDIPATLANSRKAAELAPRSALTHARLAEVWLMTGNASAARNAANRAVEIDPNLSKSHAVLGFASLQGVNPDAAGQAFDKAIALDSTAPLPRLGLGLMKIRQGELPAGREEIETAALLDPTNALLRSYLGKAYYEERRSDLAATQFDLAKQFDERDPTAWYYDAIRKQSENRPIEALKDIQTSIDRNDNRAVYRSRLLLDQDVAARNASQARIYQDLGFERLARNEAYKSLQTSAASHSAHRLLSDSYSEKPLHEKARLSELLQSQLTQPLNKSSIQPQLTASNLGILSGAGPSAGGYSEYTPLFTRNGLDLQVNAIGGNNGTAGEDLIISGLEDRVAFSLGQFHYETDGWRDNSDLKQDIYNIFLQTALSTSTSIQFEFLYQEAESGDLGFRFDPEDFFEHERNELDRRLGRIGLHHQFSPRSHLLVSAIYQDLKDTRTENSTTFFPAYPEPDDPYSLIEDSLFEARQDSFSKMLELQYTQQLNKGNFTIGGGYFVDDFTRKIESGVFYTLINPGLGEEEFSLEDPTIRNEIDPRYKNVYLYTQVALPARFEVTLGVSHEDLENFRTEEDQWSPKFGLTWEPLSSLTLRTAFLKNIARPKRMERTVEPTQVAGFNQLFDDTSGSEIKQFGLGLDAELGQDIQVGAEYNRRDLRVPINYGAFYQKRDDNTSTAYLYWTATDRLSLSLSYEKEYFKSTKPLQKLITQRVPIGFNYHLKARGYLQTVGTYVDQKIRGSELYEQDNFWNIDTILGYRFPKRYGKFEIVLKNLFDKEFRYYDLSFHEPDDTQLPLFQPERQLLARFTLNL